MTSGSLVDLDPPAAPERRWPFYVAWLIGGTVIGGVLLSHVPGPVAHRGADSVAQPGTDAPPARP
jgi:hypothetical protein